MLKGFGIMIGCAVFIVMILAVRHATHMNTVSKELDKVETSQNKGDCFPKEALDVVALNSSKKTVDFIVNKMISEKFIIVNKDGISYRFKLVKTFKQKK